MPVLDASVALSWMFERESQSERKRSSTMLDALESAPAIVPALWQAEVLNGLLVGERRNVVTPAQSLEYLARLGQLPIAVDAVTPISRRDSVIELARRYGLNAYDSSYLELAIRAGGPLATFNRNLAKAAETAGIEVT